MVRRTHPRAQVRPSAANVTFIGADKNSRKDRSGLWSSHFHPRDYNWLCRSRPSDPARTPMSAGQSARASAFAKRAEQERRDVWLNRKKQPKGHKIISRPSRSTDSHRQESANDTTTNTGISIYPLGVPSRRGWCILERQGEDALWQQVFMGQPARRRVFRADSKQRKRAPAPWPAATA